MCPIKRLYEKYGFFTLKKHITLGIFVIFVLLLLSYFKGENVKKLNFLGSSHRCQADKSPGNSISICAGSRC